MQPRGASSKNVNGRPAGRGGATPSPGPRGRSAQPARRTKPASGWADLAPVYDTDGPHVRLGVGWFLLAVPAVAAGSFTAAVVYGAAVALGARQAVRAWRSVSWQADMAAVLAALPVFASLFGLMAGVGALAVAGAVAFLAGAQEPASGLRGGTGRLAAAGIMVQAVVPLAVAGMAVVLVSNESMLAALLLVLMASAYEAGDFVIGSGGWTPLDGPLAGMVAFILVGFPASAVWMEPFDVMKVWVLVVAALTCLLGQWMASATLPKAGAKAPALRRVDTLLVLAPMWLAISGAFA